MVTLQTMVNSKAAKAILAGDNYTMATPILTLPLLLFVR